MQNVTQPFVKLSTANAELITNFAKSPEMAELANTSAQKYFELAQKSFGRTAATEAHADLVRRLTENYATFAQEYSESLIGIAAEGQKQMAQQVQKASDQVTKAGQAGAAAVADASNKMKPPRTKA
jgi:cell division septum initiation protein DivIVA